MAKSKQKMMGRAAVMLGFAEAAWERGEFFFYIRIPESLEPMARGDRYEDPLQQALAAEGVGEITGGGSQLGEGTSIEYCGIDVVVRERVRGLELIRSVMQRLNAPTGTVVEEYLPSYREHPIYEANE